MAGDQYPFPEDEFDVLGRDRSPQAVHRAPRSWWRTWWPLIAVVIVAPLVAIGLVQLASNGGNDAETPTPTTEQSEPAGTEEPPPATGEETTPEGETPQETAPPEETPTPEVTIDQSVAVAVLNGARIQGLAGDVQTRLQGEGWTAVTAGNYTSAQPETSTVFYAEESLLPAAQAIADSLGIPTVTLLGDGSVPSITVVLRPDFAG